jgi:glycosyltransferase involved in cell wall biosynthesis
MRKKRVILVGALNLGGLPAGGEEYKNRILKENLDEYYELITIDTHNWKKRPLVLILLVLRIFIQRPGTVIISASSLSSYRLIRAINFLPARLGNTVYLVIGGYFPEGVASGRYRQEYYTGLKSIVVEGEMLKKALETTGLSGNVSVIPNFKPVKETYQKKSAETSITTSFVFLSSISDSKGVDLLFEAASILIADGFLQFTIDFWGPVEAEYKGTFHNLLDRYPDFCTYKGYINILSQPDESYKQLAGYDCMVFPTRFEGEGFPGVVLDAYIAGLPVIASDWNMNREVVIHGKTGLIFPASDASALAARMKEIMLDKSVLPEMRENCNREALKYDAKTVIANQLIKIIDRD